MRYLSNFLFSIIKYIVVSLSVTAVSLVATLSFVSGKFPPSMEQFRGMRKSISTLMALQSQRGGLGGALGKPSVQEGTTTISTTSGYQEPELADVQEYMRLRKQNSKLSTMIGGELSLSSSAPPETRQPQSEGGGESERLRKLEDLVGLMHERIKVLEERLQRIDGALHRQR